MTETPFPGGDPHLDDELLSAVLDGEAAAEESTHADSCVECGARLAALRDASLLVRTPVDPADPARRDAAIAAALAATETATVVPLRRRMPPAWLAAAAVATVAVGSIALLSTRDGGGGDDLATGDDTAATTVAGTGGDAAEESAATMSAAAPPVAGGDLGELAGADLRAIIDGSMARRETAADDADGGAAPGSAAGATGFAAPVCESETRESYPDLGPLVFHATGTFDGEPVAVLAFDVGADRWVYVLTLDGCAIRNQQTHAG